MESLNERSNRIDDFESDLHALFGRSVRAGFLGSPHTFDDLRGNLYTGQFVGEELGTPQALKWPDAGHDRYD